MENKLIWIMIKSSEVTYALALESNPMAKIQN
jgi:hypothetical protein